MDVEILKKRIAYNLPIYLGKDKVNVVDICEILDIIEVEFESGKREFIEVSCLKDSSDCYEGIPLSLFATRGGKK